MKRLRLYLLVRNVPKSDLPIERTGDEKLIVLWVEDNGSDKVNVLKYTETLLPADVPQSHGLVHAAGQDEEVLGPGHVQQVAGVAGVGHERPFHEDMSGTLRV